MGKQVVPVAAKNAMDRAVTTISAHASAAVQQRLAKAIGPTEEALIQSMQDAARQAALETAKASVTGKAKDMVRASVDRAISLAKVSGGESAYAIAARAATVIVQSECMDRATSAARVAARKSAIAAADMMAEAKLRSTLQT